MIIRIKDLFITKQFKQDHDRASAEAIKAIDKYVDMIRKSGTLPPGLNAHRAENGDTVWLGYVTVGKQGWRVIFELKDGVMVLDRLLPHDKYDIYLKTVFSS